MDCVITLTPRAGMVMSHLLIVKRLELYMDLALYKINIIIIMNLGLFVCQYLLIRLA